ncbi:MAG: helix-turn-helix domain-containing protein [Actinomycetota bacterium]|nr:helix-turn-helix domain-containing protein [Actinomycetota bacterium]
MTAKRRALAERRQIVGHSQETLAQIVGVEPTTVGRWERGETSPQPWARPKLAEALLISVEDLDHLLAGEQPAEAVSTSAAAEEPVDDVVLTAPWSYGGTVEAAAMLSGGGESRVKRRVFLSLTGTALTAPAHQWLVHEPEPLVSGLAGRRVSAGLANRLPAMIAELRTMDDVAGGGSVLSLAQHEFAWVAGLLNQASYDESTGRKPLAALAELGQLVSWGAYDDGQPGLAQRYNVAALRAAHSADDRPLGAHILGSMAKQAAHQGRPAEAVTLAETALAGARSLRSPRLQAELHIRHAYALAARHDAMGCTVAISKARDYVEQLASDNGPQWLYWIIPAWIIVEAGDSLLLLGHADQAAGMLDEGIALFDESFVRDRQIYLTHLADALTRPGKQRDLHAAADRGIAAIELAKSLDSTLGMDLLRDLYHRMKPHIKVPAVRDFVERARGFVTV